MYVYQDHHKWNKAIKKGFSICLGVFQGWVFCLPILQCFLLKHNNSINAQVGKHGNLINPLALAFLDCEASKRFWNGGLCAIRQIMPVSFVSLNKYILFR